MSDNQAQAEFWTANHAWVEHQKSMDVGFAPVLDLVLGAAALRADDHVVDIGCGTGASVVAAAKRVDIKGRVQGVDISPTLLDLAAIRTADMAHVSVLKADAQTDDLGGPFDALISRFGVMFFADTTRAFRNIKNALKPGAQLTMAAWGPAPQNPWFMVPAQVARELIGVPPKVDRSLPGPFAFEDAQRTAQMLSDSGLKDVSVNCVEIALTPDGTPDDFAELNLHIGPAQSILNHFDAGPDQKDMLRTALSRASEQFVTPNGLRVPAAIHLITAQA